MSRYDEFYNGMLRCALFTGRIEGDGDTHFDEAGYCADDLIKSAAEYLREQARLVCDLAINLNALGETSDYEQAGIDFWFTRNGHGAGFQDRVGEYGTKAVTILEGIADAFGEAELFQVDDDKRKLDLQESGYIMAQPRVPSSHVSLMPDQKTAEIQWGEL